MRVGFGALISLRHISKRFGDSLVLDDVSLELGKGEIVALVGENGAGKTTLMNVLYGLYKPDAGEIFVRDRRETVRGPGDAIRLGIGMVHQHFMLVPPLTVAENVVLGREPTRRGLLDLDAAAAQVEDTCRKFGFKLDPRARVEDLSVGSQQKVEIVKALHRGADVLILDEPTAVLTPQEADELFVVARRLAAEGHTVIFISHKLREVLSVAERVAVMRRGKKVADVSAKDVTQEELIKLMLGEPVEPRRSEQNGTNEPAASAPAHVGSGPPASARSTPSASSAVSAQDGAVRSAQTSSTSDASIAPSPSIAQENAEPAAPSAHTVSASIGPFPSTAPALSVDALSDGGALKGVTLHVRPGEIVGIAGLDGNGQRELAEALTGLRRVTGSYLLLGRTALHASPGELRARGIGHVPEDRLLRAIVGPMSVEENLALGRHMRPPFARGVLIDFAGRREHAQELIAGYDVRPPDPAARIAALSGGNQQKVVLARELDASPKILIVVQPTRGLDIATVRSVHVRLREQRAAGAAIVLVSLDLEEILELSDRVYVMFEGRVNGEFSRAEFDERRIGRVMLGERASTSPEAASA